MGKIMRNDIPYCVGGDDAFRYVNDVTDENYGWIQYQLEDGSWVNYKCANRLYLVDGGKNNANFKYTGDSTATPSIVSGDGLTIGAKTSVAGLTQNMTFDSEYIDFTKYNSLVFDHLTTLNGGPTSLTKLQILDKSGSIVYTKIYFVNSSATSSQYKTVTLDDVIMVDVSELSGEHSVRVYFDTYGQGLMNTVKIKACYLSMALTPDNNVYIIKDGTLNDDYTFTCYSGGWHTPTITQQDGYVQFYHQRDENVGYVWTNQCVDVTNFSKLKFTVIQATHATWSLLYPVGLCTNAENISAISGSIVGNYAICDSGASDYEIDTSNISGDVYIYIGLPYQDIVSGTTLTLSDLHFE